MKQTAVEFLEEEIFRKYKFKFQNINCEPLEKAIAKAKEMEKQQIIDAHLQGSKSSILVVSKYININKTLNAIEDIEKGIDEHTDGIEYYNETFKNK